jgi:sulfonate transport system substrate-binding protein
MNRRQLIKSSVTGAAGLLVRQPARAASPLTELRFGVPGVGIGNRPIAGGSPYVLLDLQGTLANELKPDGIAVKWMYFRGAGPAVNEAVANGLLDVFNLGHLPGVVGRASGLKTRLLACSSRRGHVYVAVPSESSVASIEELRGKRVAIFKGTATQLSANRVLEGHGLHEKDLRTINMDSNTGKAALATKDIDALFGGQDLIALRDQGIAKIIYTSKGDSPTYPSHGGILARQELIDQHPEVVQKVVTLLVKTAAWASDERNRTALFQYYARSGVPFSNYKEGAQGEDVKGMVSPLLDEYVIARYQAAQDDARKYGLVRNTFDVEAWSERRFLDRAIRDLKLEGFWPEWDQNGKPKPPAKVVQKSEEVPS